MKCPKCNTEIADGSKFCVHCGNKISAESDGAVFCVKCGEKLKKGTKFCGKCGAKQDAAQNVTQNATQTLMTFKPDPNSQPASAPAKQAPAEPAKQAAATLAKPTAAEPVKQAAATAPAKQAATPAGPAAAAPAKQPKKKGGKGVVIGGIVFLILLLAALLVGGYFYLTKVQGIDPFEMISGRSKEDADQEDEDDDSDKEDKDGETSGESDEDKDASGKDASGKDVEQKGDPALLNPAEELSQKAKTEYDAGSYVDSLTDAQQALETYVSVAEANHLQTEASAGIANAYDTYVDAIIEYGGTIESLGASQAVFQEMQDKIVPAKNLTQSIKDAGYEINSGKFEDYYSGLIGRYRLRFIQSINEITGREQWSRDEAWSYANQAYSIQENGRVVLFDETNLDDPLRMRYVYCLAWITTKRCETGIQEGSMTEKDAADAIRDILPETDYNPLLIQTYITYASSAGLDDVSKYQAAYNAIVDELKAEQNLAIVNTGINSATSVDLKHFWYFNDLDGDDAYKVDIHNGTRKVVRDWIRTNIPQILE